MYTLGNFYTVAAPGSAARLASTRGLRADAIARTVAKQNTARERATAALARNSMRAQFESLRAHDAPPAVITLATGASSARAVDFETPFSVISQLHQDTSATQADELQSRHVNNNAFVPPSPFAELSG